MIITGNKIKLREKRLSDARNDFIWQKDTELAELDATPALPISFHQYLLDYATHFRFPRHDRFSFAIETTEGRHIGNCTCYDIDEIAGEAQVGIIIGDRAYWNKGYGTDAMLALVEHIFAGASMRRVYLKTLEWNLRAQKSFAKCGFRPAGPLVQDGYSFLVMEMNRQKWEDDRRHKYADEAKDQP